MGNFFRAVVDTVNAVVGTIFGRLVGERGHPLPAPSPPLDLRITFVSNQTPGSDETVSIRWDYGNADRLRSQCWQLHRVTFDGLVVSETHGCLPQALLAAGQRAQPCLSLSDRRVDFRFIGPVIFDLIAEADDGTISEQVIRLTPPGYRLAVTASGDIAGYPRFTPQNTELVFEWAFGIFEQTDHNNIEDGVIGHLARDPYFSVRFPEAMPYFLTSNRSDLREVGARFEDNGFGALRGRSFPALKHTFLTSVGFEFVNGSRTRANMVIVGLAIAIEGTTSTAPTADSNKPATVITPSARSLEPIFVQIDLRTSDQGKPTLVSDIHVGNVTQGLALCVHRGNNDSVQTTGVGAGTLSLEILRDPLTGERKSTGTITGARTGLRFERVGAAAAEVAHVAFSADWTGITLHPDDDLSGLMTAQFRMP